jgi:hypothetical protein
LEGGESFCVVSLRSFPAKKDKGSGDTFHHEAQLFCEGEGGNGYEMRDISFSVLAILVTKELTIF